MDSTDNIAKKVISIPKCLESNPVVFGLSIQTAVITLGFVLLALIMIAKSLLLSFVVISLALLNLRFEKKFKKEGGVIAYLLLQTTKQKSVRVNSTIRSLIKTNKNGK
ncbi:hypothetical protein [Flavobacterium poyangense]|uniref:hypothetical protein n=1 Tax=Flavobacterium poyangense TaxID=2204302 RepID=UPI00141EAE8F|nr:hypothetical protein [Flavobacterium sp. JXAS1]